MRTRNRYFNTDDGSQNGYAGYGDTLLHEDGDEDEDNTHEGFAGYASSNSRRGSYTGRHSKEKASRASMTDYDDSEGEQEYQSEAYGETSDEDAYEKIKKDRKRSDSLSVYRACREQRSKSNLRPESRGRTQSHVRPGTRGRSQSVLQSIKRSESRLQRGIESSRSILQSASGGRSQSRGRGRGRSQSILRSITRSESGLRSQSRGKSQSRLRPESRERERSHPILRSESRGKSESRLRPESRGRGSSRSHLRSRGRGTYNEDEYGYDTDEYGYDTDDYGSARDEYGSAGDEYGSEGGFHGDSEISDLESDADNASKMSRKMKKKGKKFFRSLKKGISKRTSNRMLRKGSKSHNNINVQSTRRSLSRHHSDAPSRRSRSRHRDSRMLRPPDLNSSIHHARSQSVDSRIVRVNHPDRESRRQPTPRRKKSNRQVNPSQGARSPVEFDERDDSIIHSANSGFSRSKKYRSRRSLETNY